MLWSSVRAGETLNMLSARLGRPACMILRANRLLSPAWLLPGREIVVPPEDFCAWDAGQCPHNLLRCPAGAARAKVCHVPRPGERVPDIARMYGLPERLVLLATSGQPPRPGRALSLPAPPAGARIVTVMPGQTAESLSLRYRMRPERFALLNSLSAQVLPGMRVLVEPGAAGE